MKATFGAKGPLELRSLVPRRSPQRSFSLAEKAALLRMQSTWQAIDLLRAHLFPQQLAFIDDPCRLKSALTARRAGKSEGVAVYLLIEALENDRAVCCYYALTRQKAMDTVWQRLLEFNSDFKLGADMHLGTLSLTFPNGSVIRCGGINAGVAEIEKLRGDHYRLVIIDEAASQRHTPLEYSIDWVLGPALQDQDGTVCLIGTPGDIPHGFFYDVTASPLEGNPAILPGWSCHRWQTTDNPVQAPKYLAAVAALRARGKDHGPKFEQEYLGRWVVNAEAMLYPSFRQDRCTVAELPKLKPGDRWRWAIACDLGDHSALCEVCWSAGQKTCYVTRCWMQKGASLTEVGNQTKLWASETGYSSYVYDSAAKQSALEMQRHQGIPWKATDKHKGEARPTIGIGTSREHLGTG